MSGNLPPGWEETRNTEWIAMRQLDSFLYAKIQFQPEHDKYVLYTVRCDGPEEKTRVGFYDDLGKALKAGSGL